MQKAQEVLSKATGGMVGKQLPTRKLGKNGPQVTALGYGTMGLVWLHGYFVTEGWLTMVRALSTDRQSPMRSDSLCLTKSTQKATFSGILPTCTKTVKIS